MGHKFLRRRTVERFIEEIPNGALFSVVFEKKDGTLRRMLCKQGVTSELRGGSATYNGKGGDAGNIGVFDHEAGEYRCFNGDRVVRVKGNGEVLSACDVADISDEVVNARGEIVKVQ